MLRSPPCRRLLGSLLFSPLGRSSLPSLPLSTAGETVPISSPASSRPSEESSKQAFGATASQDFRGYDGDTNRSRGGSFEEEKAKVLHAALQHVVKFGWAESALILGAKDAGLSPSIVGSFPRKEAALVEFFMDECLQKLIEKIDAEADIIKDLILSDRIVRLVRIRLEMQVPYISKWPQALSIQAQPENFSASFKQRATLVDEIWHAAGDDGSDIDWYVKRTILGGIYSASEVYMLTDNSPDFHNTWVFMEGRVKDAFDVQKAIREASRLAETVGRGLSSSFRGFMEKSFQR